MAASPARQIAFDVLRHVESEGAYASDLLHARLARGVSRVDATLATELTMGVLRWQRLLDFLLSRHLDRGTERLDCEVRLALRLGLYQMRFLDRVPTHAAVYDSVELVKSARKRSAGALVNAVLRKISREAKLPALQLSALIDKECGETERISILHSHPTWMVERWLVRFGMDRTLALLEANNCPARISCVLTDPDQTERIQESLRSEGFTITPGRWLNAALSIGGANPSEASTLRDGRISIQDEASQMVARLVDARAGDFVLDVCAAPGGKTAMLARAVAPRGGVVAADLHEHRLRSARENLARTHSAGVYWLALDATEALPFPQPFRRILLDAPCSGTGTLTRNPEIRWRLQPEQLLRAQCQQVIMLRRALDQLAPGGRLVYATCSLEPEENEEVVREATLGRSDLHTIRSEQALRPWLRNDVRAEALFDENGYFRTLPPESQTDGFFAATLERTDGAD